MTSKASHDIPVARLEMPVGRAVRLIALTLLDAASDAARKLESDPTSSAALYEFRVAVRRLRSWLQVWQPVLRARIRRKDERRLRRIARATSRARDIDVHLDWLAAANRSANGETRPALKSIRAEFEAQRASERDALAAAAAMLLSRHEQMQRRLAVYLVDVRDAQTVEPSFGHELGRTMREVADRLHDRLAAVSSLDDTTAIHAARIAAKRLRFLLEPVRDFLRQPGPVINALKELQDDAGAIHDAHMLTDALGGAVEVAAGVPKLARRVGAKARKSSVTLEENWLGASSAPFFARVRRLAELLDR